jgi:Cdc6-like AAA superfamily ATPase
MPGTGKTATTLEVVKKLLRESEMKKKSHSQAFEFIHINAMALTNPNLVYSILNEKITGRRVNPTSSATFLDEFFKKKDKMKVLRDRGWGKTTKKSRAEQERLRGSADKLRVLLIDELDALVTKK